jgi:saccharopine dehydrogenase (NAD+, L-lysine-forming)
MRCCIIGAGMQGAVTASMLARDLEEHEIVLCDADLERARRVADHIGCERLSTARVEATDVASMAAAARGSDVVLDLLFFDYAANVRRAALAAGCHYVDSASDARFQHDVAFAHRVADDEAFREAGLSAVVSCGWAPGVTNVLARLAADQLDEVDALDIRLGFDKALLVDAAEIAHPFRPHASPEVILADYAAPALHFTGGRPTRVPPFSIPELYEFGGRIGELLITSHDHDEPYTLPLLIGKGMKECSFRYPVNDQAATFVAMGMADPERVVELADGTRVKPFDVLVAVTAHPADQTLFGETPEALAAARDVDRAMVVEVAGRREGRERRVRIVWYLKDDAELRTGLHERFGSAQILVVLPVVGAAKTILRGEVQPGVLLPEQLDPRRFLDDLVAAGYPLNYEMTVV